MTVDGGEVVLARPGEVPEARLYAKVQVGPDGRVTGQWRRRRSAEHELWELPGGTVVRYRRTVEDQVVEDHLFDGAGGPLVTVFLGESGPERAVLGTAPEREVPLAGFADQAVPRGTLWLPSPAAERPEGGARAEVLGGIVEVWVEPPADVFTDAFRDGLAAACGCVVLDRASAWIDGLPGVRYRLALAGEPREVTDVWAVPLGDATWVLTFRVMAPEDPVLALVPARALLPGITLEEARR